MTSNTQALPEQDHAFQSSLSSDNYYTTPSAASQVFGGIQNGFGTDNFGTDGYGTGFMASLPQLNPSTNQAGFPAVNQFNGMPNGFSLRGMASVPQPRPSTNQTAFPAVNQFNGTQNGFSPRVIAPTPQPQPSTNQAGFPAVNQSNGTQDGFSSIVKASTLYSYSFTNQTAFPAVNQRANGSQGGIIVDYHTPSYYTPSSQYNSYLLGSPQSNGFAMNHHTPSPRYNSYPLGSPQSNGFQMNYPTPPTSYNANSFGSPNSLPSASGAGTRDHRLSLPSSSAGGDEGSAVSSIGLGHNPTFTVLPDRTRPTSTFIPDRTQTGTYWCPDPRCRRGRSRPWTLHCHFTTKQERDDHLNRHRSPHPTPHWFPAWLPKDFDRFDSHMGEHTYSLGVPKHSIPREDPHASDFIKQLKFQVKNCPACSHFEAVRRKTLGTMEHTPEFYAYQAHESYHNWILHELDKRHKTAFAGTPRFEIEITE